MKPANKAKIKCDIYTTIFRFKKILSTTRNTGQRRAFLFSCPDHGNAGDIAIEAAEKEFIRVYFKQLATINTRGLLKQSNVIKEITPNDVLFIQGGGSFGGLYDQSDIERLALFRVFKNNKIISFPQSVHFTDKKYIKMYRRILKKRKNIFLFFREKMSFDLAVDSFPFMKERIFLVPDIVMLLDRDKWVPKNDRKYVTLTFRKDKERKFSDEDNKILVSGIKECDEKITILNKDTYEEINYCLDRKEPVLRELLDAYSKSKLIITDRLHGMILAYITDTPCIAVSNNNGKVKSMYETWLKGCEFISFFEKPSAADIVKEARRLIKMKHDTKELQRMIKEGFRDLIKTIEK